MIKTFVENVLDVCEKLNIGRDKIKITYDKMHNATVEITVPMHHFEICERDFDESVMWACDAEKLYEVYRNDNCVFVGNDMYDKVFFNLLENVLKLV